MMETATLEQLAASMRQMACATSVSYDDRMLFAIAASAPEFVRWEYFGWRKQKDGTFKRPVRTKRALVSGQ